MKIIKSSFRRSVDDFFLGKFYRSFKVFGRPMTSESKKSLSTSLGNCGFVIETTSSMRNVVDVDLPNEMGIFHNLFLFLFFL